MLARLNHIIAASGNPHRESEAKGVGIKLDLVPPVTSGTDGLALMASPRWLKWLVALVMLLLAAAAIGTSILIADRQEASQRVARYNMS